MFMPWPWIYPKNIMFNNSLWNQLEGDDFRRCHMLKKSIENVCGVSMCCPLYVHQHCRMCKSTLLIRCIRMCKSTLLIRCIRMCQSILWDWLCRLFKCVILAYHPDNQSKLNNTIITATPSLTTHHTLQMRVRKQWPLCTSAISHISHSNLSSE